MRSDLEAGINFKKSSKKATLLSTLFSAIFLLSLNVTVYAQTRSSEIKTVFQNSSQHEKLISDSLVTNLRCNYIKTAASIFNYVDAKKAFTLDNQIQEANWGFMAGLAPIANCWSLSRTQRLFFYLARFNENSQHSDAELELVSNMIRGSTPEEVQTTGSQNQTMTIKQEKPFHALEVFHIPEKNLKQSWGLAVTKQPSFWTSLMKTREIDFQSVPNIKRNFKLDIQTYQKERFFKTQNLSMVLDANTSDSNYNQRLAEKLVSDVRFNRLPLIILRAGPASMHVVLVKSFQKDALGNIVFDVYDSNQPREKTVSVHYLTKEKRFKAPKIIEKFVPLNSQQEIRVFNVDDQDMIQIGEALHRYYSKKCSE